MTLGGKYKEQKDNGAPKVGQYFTDVGEDMIKPRSYEAMILPEERPKRYVEPSPDAG